MPGSRRGGHSLTTICAGVLLCTAAYPEIAFARDTFTVDITAGLEGSTNPYLETNGGHAAVGAAGSVDANYHLEQQRTTIDLGATADGSAYFNGRSSDYSAGARAKVQHRLSGAATFGVFGNYTYTQSSGGFRSARTTIGALPIDTRLETIGTTPVAAPPLVGLIDTQLPPDVTLIGRRLTEQSFGGGAQIDLRVGARNTLSVSADYNRVTYTDPLISDYRTFRQSASFARRLSAATSVTAQVKVAETRYDNGERDTIVTPMVGVNRRLSRILDVSLYGGVSVVRTTLRDGTRIRSSKLALSGSLCGKYERSSLCLNGSRQEAPTAFGGVRSITSVGVTYFKLLKPGDTLTLAANFDRSGSDTRRLFAPQTSANGSVRYDHRLSGRLGLFGTVEYLRLWQSGTPSRSDLRGVVGVALKLGDQR